MLQREFEERIGKSVDVEVFEVYNKMYMAVDVDKDTFVAMLDKRAIPESRSAYEARIERMETVEKFKERIKLLEGWIENSKWAVENDIYPKLNKTRIKNYKEEIKELKLRIKAE